MSLYVLNSGSLYAYLIATWALGLGIGILSTWAQRQLKLRGTHYALLPDWDAGTYELHHVRLEDNEFELPGPDGTRRYLTDARTRLSGIRPLHIIHKRHGWALGGPSDAEALGGDAQNRLLTVANPRAYAHAVAVNEASDAVNAQSENDPWQIKALPWALAGLCLCLAGIGATLWLLTKGPGGI